MSTGSEVGVHAADMADDHNAGFDKATLKQRSVRGATVTFAAQALKFGLKFTSTVILARFLSPADFGIMAMVAPLLAFAAAITDLGLAQAIIQRRTLSPAEVNALFWLNIAVGLGMSLLLTASAPVVALIYGEQAVIGPLVALSAIVLVNSISMVPVALLSRQMRFVSQTATEVCGVATAIVATLVAAWAGFSYWSLVIGQIAGGIATLISAFGLARWLPGAPAVRVGGVREMVKFGLNLTGVNLASFFSMMVDNMIIGAMAGKVALGLYDRSYTLVLQPLNQLLAPMGRIALPLLSRLRDDAPLYRRTFVQMLSLTLWLTLPLMVFCAVLGDRLILFLWGDRWVEAIPVFRAFAVGGVFAPVFMTTSWLFVSEGRTREQFHLSVATAIISVISFLIGVRWGALGVVIVNGTTFVLLQTPLMVWGATRNGIVQLKDLGLVAVPIGVPAALTAGALWIARPYVEGWVLGPALLLSYAAFTGGLVMFPSGRRLWILVWRMALSLISRERPLAVASPSD